MNAEDGQSVAQHCKDLIVAFAHLSDAGAGDKTADLFAPDGVWVSGRRRVEGRDNLLGHFGDRPPKLVVRHLLGHTAIDVKSEREALGLTYYLVFAGEAAAEGDDRPLPLEQPFSMGEWHTRFVKQPQGWRIAQHEVKRLFQRTEKK